MLRAIREIQPRWVVGENVSGLLNWNRGMVLDEIKADLEAAGFEVLPPLVLPACGVNAPHRRDRVWIVAYNNKWGRQEHELCTGRNLSKKWNDSTGVTADTTSKRLEGGKWWASEGERFARGGEQTVANPNSSIRRKGRMHQTQQQEAERYAGSFNAQGNQRSSWDNFPTQSPIRGRDDGIPTGLSGITISKHRTESIKAYGNSIVPQVVFEIFKLLK